MIEGLKPYREYKDSGVPWLGKIPSQWEIRRMKLLLREVDARSSTGREQLLRVSQYTGVTKRSNDGETPDTRASSLVGYKRVAINDLVINIMLAWNGSMGVSRYEGIVSPAYCVYRFREGVQPWYYHELLRSPIYKGRIRVGSTGVVESRLRLYSDDLGRIEAIRPPRDEQDAIVRFLEHANGRVERAIRAKKKLIALLHEQKQVIIHRAVTRGLDPSAPLKPSGNVWLGDIPRNWQQHSLWTLSKVRIERNPGNLPLLSVFLDRGVIRYEEGGGQVHAPSLDLSNYQVVHVGDFVLNNQQAWRGSVGVSAHHGIISPAYIVLQISKRLDSKYANYLMRSPAMVDQFVAASKGVGDIQRQVFWPFLRIVQVPLPKVDEQKQIASHLDMATAGLNRAIAATDHDISLLREYRTRLIADVVTGKLDVREAAKQLPATAETPVTEPDAEELPDDEAAELATVDEAP
jgi:type I restriction enzyme S subunit